MAKIAIVGAGLAGCECALALARAGIESTLFEQKPEHKSAAHKSDKLAELVCSNSLRSDDPASAIGLLKEEMRRLGSSFMEAADMCRVPAGKALAVDREKISQLITQKIQSQPLIRLTHRQVLSLDDPALADFEIIVCATGPMTHENFAASLAEATGSSNCYFYDAIAPIVWASSLDMNIVFRASRYGTDGERQDEAGDIPSAAGDYLNCPMNRDEYMAFYEALLCGKTMPAHNFEKEIHFEGCMPIEALAARGPKTLAFGPLKPVGLIDPRSGRRPYAVLQLRAENLNTDACNLVGCQTKLLQGEQKRIFSLVPGLEHAEFVRYGSMHRNIYVNAPTTLNADLSLKNRPNTFLAGQITGVEGYVESAACGLWLGLHLAARNITPPPAETALGSLLNHLRTPAKNFQPSNANFGLMPIPEGKIPKKERKLLYSSRARAAFSDWLSSSRLA